MENFRCIPDSGHLPPPNDLDHQRFLNGLKIVGHDNLVPIAVLDDELEAKLL